MTHTAAFETEPNLSIALTIYTTCHYQPASTRRVFSLRNLDGETLEQQIDHARQIMNEVAQELHYLTGFGIDKGVISAGSKQVGENFYPDLRPRLPNAAFYYGVLFQFRAPYMSVWAKGNERKQYVPKQNWLRVGRRSRNVALNVSRFGYRQLPYGKNRTGT